MISSFKSERDADQLWGMIIFFFAEDIQLSYLHGTFPRSRRGTKSIKSIVKSILSNTKPYVVPEDPNALRKVLVDLANRIVELEGLLEEFKRDGDTKLLSSPPIPASLMTTYYTPASAPNPESDGYELHEEPDAPTAELIKDSVKIDHVKTRHFGQSSSVSLLASAVGEGQDSVAGEIPLQRKKGPSELEQRNPKHNVMNVNRRAEFWNVHSVRSFRLLYPLCH